MKYTRILSLLTAACLLIAAFLFASCASFMGNKDKFPPLNGMIYDRENRPVTDASIQIDGAYAASSDIHGHFSLANVKQGLTHHLLVTKKGFEQSEVDLIYSDPTQVLYINMFTAGQLISEAEKSLQAQDWTLTQSFLARAQAAGGDQTAMSYLNAVLLIKTDKYPEAVSALKALELTSGKTDPYIYLFLADIYQYHMADNVTAREYLQKFLESRSDPDVELRMKEIDKEIDSLRTP